MTRTNLAVENLQLLRDASRRIKELSAAATPGPWFVEEVGDFGDKSASLPIGRWRGLTDNVGFGEDFGTAEHVATWDPDVALIVAGWIDKAGADLWAHGPLPCGMCDDGCEDCDDILWAPHVRQALKLAAKILGQTSETP